jgi:hypothetical protein
VGSFILRKGEEKSFDSKCSRTKRYLGLRLESVVAALDGQTWRERSVSELALAKLSEAARHKVDNSVCRAAVEDRGNDCSHNMYSREGALVCRSHLKVELGMQLLGDDEHVVDVDDC